MEFLKLPLRFRIDSIYMRILIVEDEHKIAAAIKRGLEQESYAVDVEHEGESGYGAVQATEYDLLILDLMLPGSMDGIAVCQRLREDGNHVPILMLTAKDTVGDRVTGLDSGADDYLVKPFAFEELLARVRALLRRPQDATGTILEVGRLKLDTATYAVTNNGQSVELSSKEYALLEYLMRNSGRILSKDSIIEHVWDYDADILPNTVEVYIKYLRTKLDLKNGDSLITTVRGFGYRLEA